jgi:membrane complex biogenesis BtpA family protein
LEGFEEMREMPSLIGVIHLPPLPGTPRRGAALESPSALLQRAGQSALREAVLLSRAGFDAIILENFGDVPFYKDRVPPETVASMAVLAAAIREVTKLPIGINVLRNDGFSALAIAAVTGCDFIRVNVLNGVSATDQGLIEGRAAELLREKERLGADIAIFGDAHVKHAKTLSSDDLEIAIEDVGLRALADAVIVTGATTGRVIDLAELERASRICREKRIPLFIGSGTSAKNISQIRPFVDGVIVGSAVRRNGKAGQPLDPGRLKEYVKAFRSAERSLQRKKPKKRGKK